MSDQTAPNLRDRILAFDDSDSETVVVPEWGGVKIEIRSITAGQRGRMLKDVTDPETDSIDAGALSVHLILATAHDPETGERIFTRDDYAAIEEKSPGAIDRLMAVATRLSALDREEVADLGPSSSPATIASTESEGSPSISPSDSGTPTPTG